MPFNVIVNVIGLEVASFVLPVTVSADLFVMSPAAGDEIVSVGGTVSIVNVDVTVDAALPSLSDAVMVIVWFPSLRAVCGVNTN